MVPEVSVPTCPWSSCENPSPKRLSKTFAWRPHTAVEIPFTNTDVYNRYVGLICASESCGQTGTWCFFFAREVFVPGQRRVPRRPLCHAAISRSYWVDAGELMRTPDLYTILVNGRPLKLPRETGRNIFILQTHATIDVCPVFPELLT